MLLRIFDTDIFDENCNLHFVYCNLHAFSRDNLKHNQTHSKQTHASNLNQKSQQIVMVRVKEICRFKFNVRSFLIPGSF